MWFLGKTEEKRKCFERLLGHVLQRLTKNLNWSHIKILYGKLWFGDDRCGYVQNAIINYSKNELFLLVNNIYKF